MICSYCINHINHLNIVILSCHCTNFSSFKPRKSVQTHTPYRCIITTYTLYSPPERLIWLHSCFNPSSLVMPTSFFLPALNLCESVLTLHWTYDETVIYHTGEWTDREREKESERERGMGKRRERLSSLDSSLRYDSMCSS